MQNKSDQELLSLMQSGESRAFAEIYRRYRRGLYAFCLRLLADAQAAEDAVHETFVKLNAGSRAIAEPAALKSWLYSVARNEGLMARRRGKDIDHHRTDTVWDDETPLSITEKADIQTFVRDAVSRLKTEYREVILLREFEGLSYEEITAVTGDSASSVKSRLFKARRALAEALTGVWNEEREDR